MAASTATQPPERASTVCEGSSHGRAASLTAGASSADSAMSSEIFIQLSSSSRIERQRHGAELFTAGGARTPGRFDGPVERDAYRFAAAHLADGFDDYRILPRLERCEWRLRRIELQQ